MAILAVLAGMAVPITRHNIKRQREAELRMSLQKMRSAIDAFQRAALQQLFVLELEGDCCDQKNGFYPKKMSCLVEGMSIRNSVNGDKMYFLRQIPRDPMTNSDEWGFRSSLQDPEEDSWDSEHIYDVYTKSQETALNGTKYKEW